MGYLFTFDWFEYVVVILREERPKDPRLERRHQELRILRYAQDDTRYLAEL